MDSYGNALLGWAQPGSIQVAALAADRQTWQVVTQLGTAQATQPYVSITSNGDALALWIEQKRGGAGDLQTSIFTGLFASAENLVPLSFEGQVLGNRLLKKTDSIHRLTWNSNPNPVIASYILLRNGILLSTMDAYSERYIYDDYGRTSTDIYTLFSLTATNVTIYL